MPHLEALSVSNEDVSGASDSFWDIGQYKRVVRRSEDGLKLCSEFMQMLRERGDIEASYAKTLYSWSKKWSGYIEKSAEYGSTRLAWNAVTEEARSRGDLHMLIRDRLTEEVYNVLKLWSKDNFHRTAFGSIKESREIEDSFRKAQKTWTKLYAKMVRARREYFNASRLERTAINQEKNANNNLEVSLEQAKKFTEKVTKCKDERERAESAYRKALDDLNTHKPRYEEDMTQVFKRCQEMELKRLKFFKEMFSGVHICLDLSSDSNLKTIYSNMRNAIDSTDGKKDVDYWEKTYGPGMHMNWPVFETYTPEIREIVNKRPTSKHLEPVTLISQRLSVSEPNGGNMEKPKSEDTNAMSEDVRKSCVADQPDCVDNATRESLFDDEWSDVDDHKPGVLVKALYDYEKQEDDELSFKKGDIFEKLEDEDEQGWCKGRKDGVTGLYPANYAAVHCA